MLKKKQKKHNRDNFTNYFQDKFLEPFLKH